MKIKDFIPIAIILAVIGGVFWLTLQAFAY